MATVHSPSPRVPALSAVSTCPRGRGSGGEAVTTCLEGSCVVAGLGEAGSGPKLNVWAGLETRRLVRLLVELDTE